MTFGVEINDDVGERVENGCKRRFGCSCYPEKAVGLFVLDGFFEKGNFTFGLEVFEITIAKNHGQRSHKNERGNVDDHDRR